MGGFDTVEIRCPSCGKVKEVQSKGGECYGAKYKLAEAPANVLSDVNRHAPFECEKCGNVFEVQLITIAREINI